MFKVFMFIKDNGFTIEYFSKMKDKFWTWQETFYKEINDLTKVKVKACR